MKINLITHKIIKQIVKHKYKIILVIVIWSIIVAANYFLNSYLLKVSEEQKPKTSYNPNTPVMGGTTVPKIVQEPIADLIDQYIKLCNNKDYEAAYAMITEECKEAENLTLNEFKAYVDTVFNTKKIYNIQNYSNVGKTYIYNVSILDDILATGTTGQAQLMYYEEKFVIQEINGNLTLAIRGYVGNEEVDNIYEDKYMKVSLLGKRVSYDQEIYQVKVVNRSKYSIVIADFYEQNEVVLDLGTERRAIKADGQLGKITIPPLQTWEFNFAFNKYFDEGKTAKQLMFNKVRILDSYSGSLDLRQTEIDNAVDVYGFDMSL